MQNHPCCHYLQYYQRRSHLTYNDIAIYIGINKRSIARWFCSCHANQMSLSMLIECSILLRFSPMDIADSLHPDRSIHYIERQGRRHPQHHHYDYPYAIGSRSHREELERGYRRNIKIYITGLIITSKYIDPLDVAHHCKIDKGGVYKWMDLSSSYYPSLQYWYPLSLLFRISLYQFVELCPLYSQPE